MEHKIQLILSRRVVDALRSEVSRILAGDHLHSLLVKVSGRPAPMKSYFVNASYEEASALCSLCQKMAMRYVHKKADDDLPGEITDCERRAILHSLRSMEKQTSAKLAEIDSVSAVQFSINLLERVALRAYRSPDVFLTAI